MPKQDACHITAGPCTWSEAFFCLFFCTAKAAVYGSLVRPFRRAIRAALTSPCKSLAFEGFPTRANMCSSPVTRAARSMPMTSLAHRTCSVSRAGQPERFVPGTRSANRTRGAQHVDLHTRARMWTRPFQIHTTFLLTVQVAVLYHARDVPVPASNRANVRLGRSQNTERTSHAASGGAGAVTKQLRAAYQARYSCLPSESVRVSIPRTHSRTP